jgi:ERI1 exoribonuclease 3
VSCGDWDLKTCLKKETAKKKIQLKNYMKSWINLKKVYPGGPVTGMVEALKKSNLELIGKHHSGIDDTVNIARVIEYLLQKNFSFTRSMVNSLI